MSKFLTPESVAARSDAGAFSRQKLAMLKRIFELVCEKENIVAKEQRDELAANLLEAAKFTEDVDTLVAVMEYDIAGYRR